VPEHVGVRLEAELGLHARPLDHPSEACRREGRTRSEVKTKGDLGSWSRCSRRSDRSSSPRIGWVLGVPFLTLGTCRAAELKST
jgi:hypothetical protein